MEHWIGFMDNTIFVIARQGDSDEQSAAFKGHKSKKDLKIQAKAFPNGFLKHAQCPKEGRWHDWALYVQSGIED